jgi:AcrR family transcriptional regulator
MSLPSDAAQVVPPTTAARRAPRQSRSRHLVEVTLTACADLIAERGLAALNTNAVAERAGVSVGSIYQYFPDKAALVAALRQRHALALDAAIEATWQRAAPVNLQEAIAALVRGLFDAHALAPALHAELASQEGFFEMPRDVTEVVGATEPGALWLRWRRLVGAHRSELLPTDLDLAAWVALRMADSLASAGAMRVPRAALLPFMRDALVDAAVQAVSAYLTGGVTVGAMGTSPQRATLISRDAVCVLPEAA